LLTTTWTYCDSLPRRQSAVADRPRRVQGEPAMVPMACPEASVRVCSGQLRKTQWPRAGRLSKPRRPQIDCPLRELIHSLVGAMDLSERLPQVIEVAFD
jgi:hypothetical protein